MNELITAALNAGDLGPLVDFPPFLLNEWELEIMQWIFEYKREFGKVPTVDRVCKKFPSFVPISDEIPLPLLDIAKMMLATKRNAYAATHLAESLSAVREKGEIPMDTLSEMMSNLSITETTTSRYTTFDRSEYFREGDPIKLGWALIDKATGGIYPGEFFLEVGRLGTGKTTNIITRMANWLIQKKRILMISKEMPPSDIFAKLDATFGHFNPLRIRNEKAESLTGQLEVVKTMVGTYGGEVIAPVAQVYSPTQIATMAKYMNVDIIVIDGIYHLMPDGGGHGRANWEMLVQVSRETKQMALGLKLPVIASSQLKRTGEREVYTAEDIAYSDALGQDADFVLSLRNMKVPGKNRTEMLLLKNRYGPEAATIIDTDFDMMTTTDVSVDGESWGIE